MLSQYSKVSLFKPPSVNLMVLKANLYRSIFFRTNFALNFKVTVTVFQKTQTRQKKSKIRRMVSKWRQKTFEISRHKLSHQRRKKTFSRRFFYHRIWLINKECMHNDIAEIELEKSILLRDKRVLNSALNLLLLAN